MYDPHSAAAQRTGSAVPDVWPARCRTAQDRQDPLVCVPSAAGPCSFDKTLDSPVPGQQAARCTSLSKPLPGCRAPACELCLPHHGSGSSENGLLRGTYSCTLCVGPLMCASSGSLYSARASGCLFLVVCLPLHSVELSLHSVDGCRALAREA